MTGAGHPVAEPAGLMGRLEARYRPAPGAVILEDPTAMVRLPLVNGVSVVLNAVFLATLLFVNGEAGVGWTTVGLGVIYLLAMLAFVVTGRAALYIHLVLWPSIAQNIAAHVMLGGFIWSGAILFWGIIVSVVGALFLGRRPGAIMAGAYLAAAIVFAFLEPMLQARRSQPALVVSVTQAVDVFALSILILVPIVILLMGQIVSERARAESLLLNVLPGVIADRLKRSPEVIADDHESCTVLFADIVGFTEHSAAVSPNRLVNELNHVFSTFDDLCRQCGAEKIKTMGDGYLAVAGAPTYVPDHARVMCDLALRMQAVIPSVNRELGTGFRLRIGLNTGRVVAGVVGTSRFSYDLWGDTVNVASRVEALGDPGSILVTKTVVEEADRTHRFEYEGRHEAKGKGMIDTYLLVGPR